MSKVKEKSTEEKDVELQTMADEKAVKAKPKKPEGVVYTYVGGGEDSPRVIDFMGKQRFVRGKPTEVTDPEIVKKLQGCPTFIEGEVDEEELHDYDEKAKVEADEQRKRDIKTNAAFVKKHKTPTRDEE